MSYLRKRVLIIFSITSAVSLVVLLLFYFLVLAPAQKQLKAIKKEAASILSSEYIDACKKEMAIKTNKCRENMDYISRFVVDANSWIDMMPYISAVAKKSELSMFSGRDISSDMYYNKDKDLKKITTKQLTVSFDSDFGHFAEFANALEKGRPVVFIKEFEIQRAPVGKNEVKMDLQILVSKEHYDFDKMITLKK